MRVTEQIETEKLIRTCVLELFVEDAVKVSVKLRLTVKLYFVEKVDHETLRLHLVCEVCRIDVIRYDYIFVVYREQVKLEAVT